MSFTFFGGFELCNALRLGSEFAPTENCWSVLLNLVSVAQPNGVFLTIFYLISLFMCLRLIFPLIENVLLFNTLALTHYIKLNSKTFSIPSSTGHVSWVRMMVVFMPPQTSVTLFFHNAFTCFLRLTSGHFKIILSLPCTYFFSSNVVCGIAVAW